MGKSRRLNVAVLGGGGTIAPALVRDLADSAEVGSLLILDLDAARAAEVAEQYGAGKATARQADAQDDLAAQLDGHDVLVNSASYRLNLAAMEAALAAGCHYLDLGGLYWMTAKQLEMDASFRSAGLTAVLGIGGSPGKTNVMAARAVRELAAVDSVHVFAAGRDLDPPPGFSAPYSVQTIVDELTLAPVVLKDGAAQELAALTDGGEYPFPEPIGAAPTIYTLHSELSTFGASFGCDEASFRLSLAPAFLERVKALVGAPAEEIAAAAAQAARPSANTLAVHVVEAAGDGRLARVTCVTRPIEDWRLGGGIVSTAAPAAATVRLLARGKVSARGVLPPERCIDPDDLFPELERHGSAFSIEIEEA